MQPSRLTTPAELDPDESGSSAPGLSGRTDAAWHVLHTKPRQEKAVARTLDAAGIDHYLPLLRRAAYYGRRKCLVDEPLFASYIFLRGTKEQAYFANTTKRIVNIIPVIEQARFEFELTQIRLALTGDAELSPYRYLEVGHRVRVRTGPFKNIEGLIESWAKADRLILQINTLGRAASLEIDASLLDPLD